MIKKLDCGQSCPIDLKTTPVNAVMVCGGVLTLLGLFFKELYRIYSLWSLTLILIVGVFSHYDFKINPKEPSSDFKSLKEPGLPPSLDAESLKDSGLEPLTLE